MAINSIMDKEQNLYPFLYEILNTNQKYTLGGFTISLSSVIISKNKIIVY